MKMFKKRYFMFDFARGRHIDKEEIKTLFDILNRAGYNGIGLHLEGFFETNAYSGIARKGCLKKTEAAWFCGLAREYHFEIIPIINLVGHAESFLYHQERFADMSRDEKHKQFNLFNNDLVEFAHKIIDDLIETFKSSYLHIGGDETTLSDEEKVLYCNFLSHLCEYVTAKGVNPCIWGDMLHDHPDIARDFNKNVAVFDWYYYGHRKSSLKFFKELGFKEIFACPCDEGWDGFIGVQHHSPWGKWPKDYEPIEFNEIEAFLKDAEELEIDNALITNWENRNACNLWSQMDAIVRAGLYMCGKDYLGSAIEECLFGKQTLHGKITYSLQKAQHALYMAVLNNHADDCLKCRIGEVVFDKAKFSAFMYIAPKIIDELKEDYQVGTEEAKSLLDLWTPSEAKETLCKASLKSSLWFAKTMYELLLFGAYGYADYREAALCQYEDFNKSVKLINNVIALIENTVDCSKIFLEMHREYLSLCGQSRFDLEKIEAFGSSMLQLKNELTVLSEKVSVGTDITLPSWKLVIDSIPEFRISPFLLLES